MQTRVEREPVRNIFSARNFTLILAALLGLAYLPILAGSQTLCYRDFGVMAIPTASYHRAMIWSGELPFWNPYSNCGVPFLAQWGTMVLYPLSLIYVLLPMPWSLNLFCILHLWIGAVGMYFVARKWLAAEWPAAMAAVAFLCNGITQSTLSWPNYTAAIGLFPWVIFSMQRAWEAKAEKSARAIFTASGVAALQLLTGVPELCILTWGLAALLWVEQFSANPHHRTRLAGRQFLIALFVGGLCAAQLLPFFQLLANSQRSAGFATEKWALPPWGWANLILPRFRTFSTAEGTVFQYGQEFLSSTYLGAFLLLIAAFALRRPHRRVMALAIVALLAAVLALGSHGILYPLILKLFPGISVARYPVKFVFLLAFIVPLLAAYGVRELAAMDSKRVRQVLGILAVFVTAIVTILLWFNHSYPLQYDRWMDIKANSLARWFLFVLGVAVLMMLSFPQYQRYEVALKFAVLGVVAFDGYTHLRNQNPTIAASIFEPGLWAHSQEFPKPEHGAGRVFISPQAEEKILHNRISDLSQNMIGNRLALWSHLNLLDQVPKVNGSATLQLRDQAVLQKYLYSGTNSTMEAWLDFLNVTLITSSNSVIEWQARTNPMPFITAGQKPVRSTGVQPLAFGKEVSLEPWSVEFETMSSTAVELSDIEVSISQISFTARTDKPAVAVLPASWHPAWTAEVTPAGGYPKSQRVLKSNLAFQAVQLPAGQSRIRLYYHDTMFYLGASISGTTLLAGGLFCLVKRKRSSQV